MSMSHKRTSHDIKDLIDSGYEVLGENGSKEYSLESFLVTMKGPKDSPYEDKEWQIRFTITPNYPFKSPSVGFVQQILHPNVDEASGSICLDSLNKSWSPIFNFKHVVETILPYLLSYPNPDDPLNRDAAHLMKSNPQAYDKKVRQHSEQYSYKRKL